MDWLPMHLIEMYEYCEVHDIVNINTLAEAPEHIRAVVMDIRNRTKILKLLYWRRATKSLRQSQQVQIYADEEEQKAMK